MKASGTSVKRKSNWILSSFDDSSDHSNKLVNSLRKRGNKPQIVDLTDEKECEEVVVKEVKRDQNSEDICWVEKYIPKCENDLAVHKKKVSEVKLWLQNHLTNTVKKDIGILLLSGPAGAGKTAMLQVITNELGCEIKEWINPIGDDYEERSSTNWRDFSASQISQSKQFSDFILRANRYTGLNMVNSEHDNESKKKVVFIEDMPNFVMSNPKKLHEILRQYQVTGRSPVVFIISDSHLSDATVYKILPKNIQNELGITNISFNSVAQTSLTKAMTKIVTQETKQLHATIVVPSKETYEMLATSSGGDIRSCINSLQFYCTNSNPIKFTEKRKKTTKQIAKKPKTKKAGSSGKDDNVSLGGRDTSLFLFRALGKILYSKRTALKKEDRISQLPSHMSSFVRDTLQIDPENVFERTQVTSDTFLLYLHQNYPEFFASIDDVSSASDYVSDADVMTGVWTTRDIMSDYSSSVSMRGIMFSNTRSASTTGAVSGGWRPLHKPEWFDAFKTKRSRMRIGSDIFQDTRHPAIDLYTEILPYMDTIQLKIKLDQMQFAKEISRFPIQRHFRPYLQTITEQSDLQVESDFQYFNKYTSPYGSHECEKVLLVSNDSDDDVIDDFDDDDPI